MRLIDLPGVSGFLETSPVRDDPMWLREAFQVDEGALTMFYARATAAGKKAAAIEAIDRTQSAAILYAFEHPDAGTQFQGVVMHSPPEEPYFVDEFLDCLIKLRPARRRACLFALEWQADPNDVTNLTFDHAKRLRELPELCQEVLAAQARQRHIRLPYVFWEWATEKIATPLLKLTWSIEDAFGCTWPHLQRRYKDMVMISRCAEATSLLQLLAETNR